MTSATARRGPSVLLALILLVGGIGLPVLDAVWFHSGPAPAISAPESGTPGLGVAGSGDAHVFACAVLTSAVSGRGLPAAHAPTVPHDQGTRDPGVPPRTATPTCSDLALQLPRAPPAV